MAQVTSRRRQAGPSGSTAKPMYETYYQLQQRPFSLLPDSGSLYLGAQHHALLSQVDDGLQYRSGFIVLTGAPGTGKTALLLRILDRYADRFTTGLVPHIHVALGTIMPLVLQALGGPAEIPDSGRSSHEAFVRVTDFLSREVSHRRQVLLAIDEAQHLTAPMFEELRLLFNTNGKSQIIHIILAGQPSLHTILKRPEMSHFAQRVAICHTIEPLSEEESVGYVRQRIQAAGATQPIFTERACRLMHRLTKGVPRLINHAGDAALSYGAACQLPWITADVLFQALRKGQGMGLRPLTEGDTPVGTHQDTAEEQREMARSGGAENSPPKPFFPEPSPTAVSATERYERGLALKNAGLYKQAIDQFQLAVDDPAMALKAYAQMGLCYKLSGRHAEAVTIFRKALSSSAASPKETIQILYVLGRSLEALGRTGEALEAYRWIRRESADYRDVVQRIERLSTRRSTPAFSPASPSETSWLGSLLRSKYP